MSHLILPLAVMALTLVVLAWLLSCVRKYLAIRARLDAENAVEPTPERRVASVVRLAPRAQMPLAAE